MPVHRPGWRSSARVVVLVLLVVAAAVTALQGGAPSVTATQQWVEAQGPLAPVVVAVLYAASVPLPVPKAVLSIAAGAALGFATGWAVVLVGATVGSVATFLVARWLARDWVERHLARRHPAVARIVHGTGFTTVLGLRLVPVVPFTALNYLLGVAPVPVRQFVAATAIGIAPGAAAYVALGSYGSQPASWRFLSAAAGLLLLSGAGVWAARRRRSAALSRAGRQ